MHYNTLTAMAVLLQLHSSAAVPMQAGRAVGASHARDDHSPLMVRAADDAHLALARGLFGPSKPAAPKTGSSWFGGPPSAPPANTASTDGAAPPSAPPANTASTDGAAPAANPGWFSRLRGKSPAPATTTNAVPRSQTPDGSPSQQRATSLGNGGNTEENYGQQNGAAEPTKGGGMMGYFKNSFSGTKQPGQENGASGETPNTSGKGFGTPGEENPSMDEESTLAQEKGSEYGGESENQVVTPKGKGKNKFEEEETPMDEEELGSESQGLTGAVKPMTGAVKPMTGKVRPMTGKPKDEEEDETAMDEEESLGGKNKGKGKNKFEEEDETAMDEEELGSESQGLTGAVKPMTGKVRPMTGKPKDEEEDAMDEEELGSESQGLTGAVKPMTGAVKPMTGKVRPMTGKPKDEEEDAMDEEELGSESQGLTGAVKPMTGAVKPMTGKVRPMTGKPKDEEEDETAMDEEESLGGKNKGKGKNKFEEEDETAMDEEELGSESQGLTGAVKPMTGAVKPMTGKVRPMTGKPRDEEEELGPAGEEQGKGNGSFDWKDSLSMLNKGKGKGNSGQGEEPEDATSGQQRPASRPKKNLEEQANGE